VVKLDVEGEHTCINESVDDPHMVALLRERGLNPAGVPDSTIYRLVGRQTSNPAHPRIVDFCLDFTRLSPYLVTEILGLNDAQAERYWQAYDVAKLALRDAGIYPEQGNAAQEQAALEVDEFTSGYPCLSLSVLVDIVGAILHQVAKQPGEPQFRSRALQGQQQATPRRIQALRTDSANSWRAVYGRLWRLVRMRVFDHPQVRSIDYSRLLRPGHVAVVDLSDSRSTVLNNLTIADLLRGIQEEQDRLYQAAVRSGGTLPTTLVSIEEAHEFLGAERTERMPALFEQVSRIAARGRKRRLGLVLVTQLPQQLPPRVFGLVNNYILHKLTDPTVISRLQRTVAGADDAQWLRVPGLAPGQALVAFGGMAHPVLVSMDPAPYKLRMTD
jgi:hypothetical protein